VSRMRIHLARINRPLRPPSPYVSSNCNISSTCFLQSICRPHIPGIDAANCLQRAACDEHILISCRSVPHVKLSLVAPTAVQSIMGQRKLDSRNSWIVPRPKCAIESGIPPPVADSFSFFTSSSSSSYLLSSLRSATTSEQVAASFLQLLTSLSTLFSTSALPPCQWYVPRSTKKLGPQLTSGFDPERQNHSVTLITIPPYHIQSFKSAFEAPTLILPAWLSSSASSSETTGPAPQTSPQ